MGATGSVMKQFNVVDVSKQKKHLLLYESYELFIRTCKAKFNISEDSKVFFVLEEDENTEVDCAILEKVIPEKSVLIIKVREHIGEEILQNKINDQPYTYEGSLGDNREKQVQSDRKESQEQFDRNENRTGQMESSEESAEKDRNDQPQENQTGEVDADCQGPSNIDNSSDFEELDKEEGGSEVHAHLDKHGFNNIGDVLKRQIDKWKEMPLNIAVTGASGKGKSSFINALRGLTELDPGAAEVDVNECTKTVTPYTHQLYDNFVIWDVPGVGTMNFPKKSYLETINVERYDFFIIVTTERFTEIDSWLLKEVACRNKQCYIIRTKIDIDLTNEKRKVRGDFEETKVFNRLKKELLQEVIESVEDYAAFDFFAISNHHPLQYDFPGLRDQLLEDVPPAKKSAMIFGVAGLSETVVKAKADVLRSRIWKVAVMSGAGAAIPLPYVSTGVEAAILLTEVLFYRRQFALDDSSLKKLATMSGVTLDEMKDHLNLKAHSALFTIEGILQLYGEKDFAHEFFETCVKSSIPVIGSVAFGGVSYIQTSSILTAILEMMQNDALKVLKYVKEKASCNDS